MARATKGNDRAIVLWLVGAVVLAVVLFSLLGPRQSRNDPTPSTENPDSRGVRGAYLALQSPHHNPGELNGLSPLNGLSSARGGGGTPVTFSSSISTSNPSFRTRWSM